MIDFEGSHGTCASMAQSIEQIGFRPNICFWGRGVYFFHRHPRGREDAVKWYQFSKDHDQYNGQADTACVVLHVRICVEESDYYCLYSEDFQAALVEVEDRAETEGYNEVQKNRLRDELLRRFETLYGKIFKVVTGTIPLIKKHYKPRNATDCIVVRDTVCIQRPYQLEECHG